jgi:T-complex protein 1 subunit gamma
LQTIEGTKRYAAQAVATALEVIPRTLAQNCGANVVRALTELRAKHRQEGGHTWGIDGTTGALADMNKLCVWEPYVVKVQTLKTSIEVRESRVVQLFVLKAKFAERLYDSSY